MRPSLLLAALLARCGGSPVRWRAAAEDPPIEAPAASGACTSDAECVVIWHTNVAMGVCGAGTPIATDVRTAAADPDAEWAPTCSESTRDLRCAR